MRGVAILLVVVGHGAAHHRLGGLAAAGVTLFFALSGYLITGNLLREHAHTGGIARGRFYWRRLTRLGPPLYVMLAVVTLTLGSSWQSFAHAATWTMNLSTTDPGLFGHTWSLAVEEQFYLLWPLVLPVLLARRRPVVALVAVTTLLIGWRAFLFLNGHYLWAYGGPETAGTAVLAGCIVALAGHRCSAREGAWCLALLCLVGAAGSFFGDQIGALLVPLLVTPAAAVVVAAAEQMPALTWRPLTFCGVVSYSVYLWHEPGGLLFGFDLLTPAGTLAGAMLGLVAYFVVEAPLMAWRSAHQARPTARRPVHGPVSHGARDAADSTPAAAVQLA